MTSQGGRGLLCTALPSDVSFGAYIHTFSVDHRGCEWYSVGALKPTDDCTVICGCLATGDGERLRTARDADGRRV